MSTNKPKTKYLSVITYCIALICLLIGFFFPVATPESAFDFSKENLLFMTLPSALGMALASFGMSGSFIADLMGAGEPFQRSYLMQIGDQVVDLAAIAVVLYAIVLVVGVIMLIPVLASKSRSKTAAGCAFTVEIMATIVLFAYTLMMVHLYIGAEAMDNFPWDWSLIGIAFGGTLLMMIIQTIGNKGASGFMKFVMALLGVAGVFMLLDFITIFGIDESKNAVFGGNVVVGFADGLYGLNAAYMLITEGLDWVGLGSKALSQATALFLGVSALLVMVNFAIDLICVGARTKKCSTVVDIIRYTLQAVFIIASIILVFCIKEDMFKPGLLMYILLVITVVQIVISAIRCAVYKPAEEYAEETSADSFEGSYYDDTTPVVPVYQTAPAYTPAPAPAPVPAPAPAPAPAQQHEYVYAAKEVYHGPTDAFISRLSDAEKIEFAKLFLEKINGSYANVPDYVIGGDNKEFFSSIFVYLGKFRSMLSDGLMNKIYNELNLLS